jgi:hypothetical protein
MKDTNRALFDIWHAALQKKGETPLYMWPDIAESAVSAGSYHVSTTSDNALQHIHYEFGMLEVMDEDTSRYIEHWRKLSQDIKKLEQRLG